MASRIFISQPGLLLLIELLIVFIKRIKAAISGSSADAVRTISLFFSLHLMLLQLWRGEIRSRSCLKWKPSNFFNSVTFFVWCMVATIGPYEASCDEQSNGRSRVSVVELALMPPCISKEVRLYQRNHQGVQPMNSETDLRRQISR